MGALSKASERRARESETDDVVELLRRLHLQLQCLITETREAATHAATSYDVFPRVRTLVEIALPAEAAALEAAARRRASLALPVARTRRMLSRLGRRARSMKGRGADALRIDGAWMSAFEELDRDAHLMRAEADRLFSAMDLALDAGERAHLGALYKQSLQQVAPDARGPTPREAAHDASKNGG